MYINGMCCHRCGKPIFANNTDYDGLCLTCRNLIKWRVYKFPDSVTTPFPDTIPMPLPDTITAPLPDTSQPTLRPQNDNPCSQCMAVKVLKELLDRKEEEIRQLKESK